MSARPAKGLNGCHGRGLREVGVGACCRPSALGIELNAKLVPPNTNEGGLGPQPLAYVGSLRLGRVCDPAHEQNASRQIIPNRKKERVISCEVSDRLSLPPR
jgi:hypothetical protein